MEFFAQFNADAVPTVYRVRMGIFEKNKNKMQLAYGCANVFIFSLTSLPNDDAQRELNFGSGEISTSMTLIVVLHSRVCAQLSAFDSS